MFNPSSFTGIPYYSATLFISDLVRMPSKRVSKTKGYALRVIAHDSRTLNMFAAQALRPRENCLKKPKRAQHLYY